MNFFKFLLNLLLCVGLFVACTSKKKEKKPEFNGETKDIVFFDSKVTSTNDTLIKVTENRFLYYKNLQDFYDGTELYYDGFLLTCSNDTIGRYPGNYSGLWYDLSPSKKFMIVDNIIYGYAFISDTDSILHENYLCNLIDLANGKVVESFQSACGGEWNEKNQWVYGEEVLFDPNE